MPILSENVYTKEFGMEEGTGSKTKRLPYKETLLPTRASTEEIASSTDSKNKWPLVSLIFFAYSIGATIYIMFLIAYSVNSSNENLAERGRFQRIVKIMKKQAIISAPSAAPVDKPPCDSGWVYFKMTDFCYFLQNFTNPRVIDYSRVFSFTEAEANCQTMGGHLASFHSYAERRFLFDLISFGEKGHCRKPHFAWIGLQRVNGKMQWTDGSMDLLVDDPPEYQHWMICNDGSGDRGKVFRLDPPGLPAQFTRFICKRRVTILRPSEKSVLTLKDSFLLTSTISAPPGHRQSLHCDPGWVYFEISGFCYYLQNFTNPEVIDYSRVFSFTEAEENCQTMGGHLVSIHSDAEKQFLLNLSSFRKNQCHDPHWVWTGFHLVNETTGAWTDGTLDVSVLGPDSHKYPHQMLCNDGDGSLYHQMSRALKQYTRYICKKARLTA